MTALDEYTAVRQSALRQSRLQGRERAILLAADACIAELEAELEQANATVERLKRCGRIRSSCALQEFQEGVKRAPR